MRTKILLPLFFITVFFSCKKEKGESIDYNAVTEERILSVSEQDKITDEDIATLERLLEKVSDNAAKTKYTEMIAGIRIIKDFIPDFQTLRTDPNVNFQDLYATLDERIKQVTDQLPRKAKLQEALAAALANYSTEEYEFPESVLTEASVGLGELSGLKNFLAKNYSIHPIEGKPNKYLRSAIESVDSLVLSPGYQMPGEEVYNSVKLFKGLRYLRITANVPVYDFNHMTHLEILEVNNSTTGWQLNIDQCEKLKKLELMGASPFGEVLDFTNKFPLLETLILSADIYPKLTALLLPDKPHLKTLQFVASPYHPLGALPNIKRLVIEAGGKLESFSRPLGSNTNQEIDEISISGIGTGVLDIYGGTDPGKFVKINKLELTDIQSKTFGFGGIDISKNIDLDIIPNLELLSINAPYKINNERASLLDVSNLNKHYNTLRFLELQNVDIKGGTLDLSMFKNLQGGFAFIDKELVEQPLKKIIMTRALREKEDNDDCPGCGFYWFEDGSVTLELVD